MPGWWPEEIKAMRTPEPEAVPPYLRQEDGDEEQTEADGGVHGKQ